MKTIKGAIVFQEDLLKQNVNGNCKFHVKTSLAALKTTLWMKNHPEGSIEEAMDKFNAYQKEGI